MQRLTQPEKMVFVLFLVVFVFGSFGSGARGLNETGHARELVETRCQGNNGTISVLKDGYVWNDGEVVEEVDCTELDSYSFRKPPGPSLVEHIGLKSGILILAGLVSSLLLGRYAVGKGINQDLVRRTNVLGYLSAILGVLITSALLFWFQDFPHNPLSRAEQLFSFTPLILGILVTPIYLLYRYLNHDLPRRDAALMSFSIVPVGIVAIFLLEVILSW